VNSFYQFSMLTQISNITYHPSNIQNIFELFLKHINMDYYFDTGMQNRREI